MRLLLACFLAIFEAICLASPLSAEEAVGRLNLAGYRHREMCTASLIAPDRALTAAHCVATVSDGYLKRLGDMVFVAGWNGESHSGAARVSHVAIHPEAFRDGVFDIAHDVAVITLAQPIPVAPLPLAIGTPDGPMTLMGYQKSRPNRLEITPYCYGSAMGALWRLRCRVEPGQSGGPVIAHADQHNAPPTGTGSAKARGRITAVISAVSEDEALVVPVDKWVLSQLSNRP